MAKCEVCGKGVSFGIKVSHSHRRSNRMWKPNVRKVRAIVNGLQLLLTYAADAFVQERLKERKFNKAYISPVIFHRAFCCL